MGVWRWTFWIACFGALLLVLGAYSNSLHNAFHFDDDHVIERNLYIRDLANIPRFFADANTFSNLATNATYRPVVTLTLAVDYWIAGGLDPVPFHVTQILLLVAVGVLLFLVFSRIFQSLGAEGWHRWAALFAALLFCIHTGNTQTANYISARSELLSGLGVLAAFAAYQYLPRSRRLHLYLVPMVFGALAKPPAVMFAPLLLVYKLLLEQQLSAPELLTRAARPRVWAAMKSSLPAFAAAGAVFLFVEGMNPPGQTYGGGDRLAYLVTQSWVWVRYVGLFLLPFFSLTADSDLTLFTRWADPRVAAGLLLLVVMLAAAWHASRSRALRPVAFGIAWFWIALAPTSSIIPIADVTNDHRVFFPFMGLALAAAGAAAVLLRTRAQRQPQGPNGALRIAAGAALLVLIAHTVGTYERNRVWATDETLWADVARRNPGNERGLMNYGLAQMQRGRYNLARTLFLRAEALNPNYSLLQANLAIVNSALGDTAAAEHHFARALELDPTRATIHYHYARWLVKHARADEAVSHLRTALQLSPGDTESRHLLMNLYAARGDSVELSALAEQTLALASTDPVARAYRSGALPFGLAEFDDQAWFTFGLQLTQADQHAQAAQAYRMALARNPGHLDAANNLGWSLAQLGFFDAAVPTLVLALQRNPADELTRNNLAWAVAAQVEAKFQRAFRLQQRGQLSAAVPLYRALLAEHPRWANARFNLAHALMNLGHCGEAVAEFESTLALAPEFAEAHLHLATCYGELGKPADAQEHRAIFEVAQLMMQPVASTADPR